MPKHQEPMIEINETPSTRNNADLEATRPEDCVRSIEKVASKLVFWQALSLTFLGEWGDRSQFTTIALAAKGSATTVFIGSFLVSYIRNFRLNNRDTSYVQVLLLLEVNLLLRRFQRELLIFVEESCSSCSEFITCLLSNITYFLSTNYSIDSPKHNLYELYC